MKNRVKIYRAKHDLSQVALARDLGVTRQTILAIKKGEYEPSLLLAYWIARYFGVRIEDVFFLDPVDNRPDEASSTTHYLSSRNLSTR